MRSLHTMSVETWERQPDSYLVNRWYAVYTCSHHERKIAAELDRRSFESFLPLFKSVRRWKDRRVELELPLFPGYVFVHLALRDRIRVLQIPGAVNLVGFGGLPAPLPDEQIETLRKGLKEQSSIMPHPYLVMGRRARILHGPLQGAEGVLLRKKGLFRVVISLELIMRSVAVEVPAEDVLVLRQ